MRNYSLVANTQFKARNFEDLIRPYAMYTQEYRAQEDALSELATKADVWQGLANEQTDPVAYAQYSNYANALRDQVNVIADRGLDGNSRQAMLNLKRRYASEITPIEQAFTTRKAQADEQRKALLQNPTLLLSRRADTTSLDRYMENPELGYDSYSGALLTQQAGQAAAAIAKELRDYGNGKRLDQFTKTWIQQHGFTASEVAFAINHPDDPRASKVLNTIVNNVIDDSGMAKWADNATMNQAYSYARQGLWQAVGQTQVTPYADKAAELAAQEAMQIRAEKRAKKNADEEAAKALMANTLGKIKPVNLYSNEEETKYRDVNNKLSKYYQYFKRDAHGNIVDINDKGKQLANEGRKVIKGRTMRDPNGEYHSAPDMVTWKNQEFRNLLKDLGFNTSNYVSRGSGQRANLQKVLKLASGDYDTTRTTTFKHTYDRAEYDDMRDLLGEALGNSSANIVDYDSKGQRYKSVGTIEKADLFKKTGGDSGPYKYNIVASKGSSKGIVYTVMSSDGKEQFDIQVPGVHPRQEKSALDAYKTAENEILLMENADTPWEAQTHLEAYQNALWAAEQALGRITYRNKTKTQEFE